MNSSYENNNYGEVFKAIVSGYKPRLCVELGVQYGYSAFHIAQALKENMSGHIDCYDLFPNSMEDVIEEFKKAELQDYASFYKENAYHVADRYENNSVSLLHVDLDNTGDIVKEIMPVWDPKLVIGGIMLFEGGTEERDQAGWMKAGGKNSIKKEIEVNPIISKKYIYGAYLAWPGLTMLLKKQ